MARIETSGPGGTGTTPAQINSQSLSQDWEVFTGVLKIYTPLTLNEFSLQIDADSIVEID